MIAPEIPGNNKGRPNSKQFDALVLLCGGVSKIGPNKWRGNFETRAKVAATAEIFHQQKDVGHAPDIISSGGAMWGAPSVGEIMTKSITSRHFGVPREKVVQENACTDSGEQVRNIKAIIKQGGYKKLGIVADSVHGKPMVTLFRNAALNAELLPMETYLIQRNSSYARVMDKLHNSWYWKWWKFKYRNLSRLIEIDPLLESPKAKVMAKAVRFMRTKLIWFRLPGTT